jgi:hypothetical protein
MIEPAPKPWQRNAFIWLTLAMALVAFVIAPRWAAASAPANVNGYLVSFGAAVLGMIFLLITFGLAVNNLATGVLLTGRNTYSLSRLQMVLWTVLILSALMATAACRAWAGLEPLAISIPTDLLEAMGISYVSAAAAPALLSLKTQAATDGQVAAAANRLRESVTHTGQVVGRPPGAPPVIADLVKGDELANAGIIDLSKVQQLIITLMLVVTYGGTLVSVFMSSSFLKTPVTLPDFGKSFVELMLVSHGGYLAYKATSKPGDEATGGAERPAPPDRNGGLTP